MKDDTLIQTDTFDYTQTIPDRFNPFDNDTENLQYRDDYRKIVPQISVKGCVIPEVPSKFEKKNIRKVYNKTSFILVFHLVISYILASVLQFIIMLVATPYLKTTQFEPFMNNTSILMDINAITYIVSNIITFLLGCSILKIPIKRVFNKPNIDTPSMVKHICITWCLQGVCLIVVSIISALFLMADINLIPDNSLTNVNYSSATYCIATFLYTCIIAPITEEMIFRGVILRGFSIVSQRFGIFMSALLFGLLHGNVLQFITTFTVGIYLGFVATKYNSILPTILLHFFINLIPTLSTIFLSSNEFISGIVVNGFYVVMIIIGIVLMCLGVHKQSNRLPIQNRSQKKRTLPIALSSLGVLTILTLYILVMVMVQISAYML